MSYRKHLSAKRFGLSLVAAALLVSSFSLCGALRSQDATTPDQSGHESHDQSGHESHAWTNNPADRNWRVELPVPVRNLLTLTGAGTTRRPPPRMHEGDHEERYSSAPRCLESKARRWSRFCTSLSAPPISGTSSPSSGWISYSRASSQARSLCQTS